MKAEELEQEVKGNLFRSYRRYLLESFGPEAPAIVAEAMPTSSRGFVLDPPLSADWFSHEPLLHLQDAIEKTVFGGDAAKFFEMGIKVSGYDLKGPYKLFFKLATPSFVLTKTNLLYNFYFRRGRFGVIELHATEKQGLLKLEGGRHPISMCHHAIGGWLSGALQLSGGREIDVQHTACQQLQGDQCHYRVRWR